jgi:hypothetical protein
MQQQRQLRLGDILDDYCPRERRVTNHAVVAMVGEDVKQVRCTTCDTEHEYKHAKVPRQRRKADTPALIAQVAAGAPKRVVHEPAAPPPENGDAPSPAAETLPQETQNSVAPPDDPAGMAASGDGDLDSGDSEREGEDLDGPVHRPLIRATLPRVEGQPPPQRPAPDFTIRQPGSRQNRFRPRNQRGGQGQGQGQGQQYFGNRSNGNPGPMRSGSMSRQGGRPQGGPPGGRPARSHGQGRKRSK